MIGGVLRHGIIGAARLAQPLRRFGVAGRAVERETFQVAAFAVRTDLRRRDSIEAPEVFERTVVIVEVEPRFGDDPFDLRTTLGHGLIGQRLAVFDDIAVVALAELDLKQVVRHQPLVGVALQQRRKALLRDTVAFLGVIDVGAIVACMIGILAVVGHPLETGIGLAVIAVQKLDIAHPHVVLLPAPGTQRAIVGFREVFARPLAVPRCAVERTEREPHVVGINRAGITLLEFAQSPFGIGASQLHGASRQVEIRFLHGAPLGRRQCLPGFEKFVARIAPASQVE